MAVHQLSRFCNDPKLCHEQATMRLGKYLAHTKDRGIIYDPNKSMGLECYVDADLLVDGIVNPSTMPITLCLEQVLSSCMQTVLYTGQADCKQKLL
jgi:hypothetical protein